MQEEDVIARIALDLPVGRFDGAGSGLGLSSCPSCGRYIDGSCSQCVSAPSAPMPSEDVLKRREELRAQRLRENGWYDRGRR